MKNSLFYLITVLIWGSTWIAIKMQLGTVDPVVSVAYRFLLAAVILFAWCKLRSLPMRFSRRDHCAMALQGVLLFGFNYLLFYLAELHLTSGLAAVIFSTIVMMNVVNGALFQKKSINKRVVIGGSIGLVGIMFVFQPELKAFSYGNSGGAGIGLCVFATLLASLGNITSAKNQQRGLPVIQTNTFGMTYGAAAMVVTSALLGKPFSIEPTPAYIVSLMYLAVFGSIIAFGCYLTLVGNIGADKAAYSTLLFPVVALLISTVCEGYTWSLQAVLGILLIVLGNFWIIDKKGWGWQQAVRFLRRSEIKEDGHSEDTFIHTLRK